MSPDPAIQMPTPACARVQARLLEYLDGALEPLAAARDEGHLEACPACAAERQALVELAGLVRAASAPEPGELDWAREGLAARLAGARAPRPRPLLHLLRTPTAQLLFTSAAAVLVFLGLERVGLFDRELAGTLNEATRISREAQLPDASLGSFFDAILGRGEGN